MNKLSLVSQFQSLCSSIHSGHTPRSSTPWGTILSTAEPSQTDCSFSAADQYNQNHNTSEQCFDSYMLAPRSISVGNKVQSHGSSMADVAYSQLQSSDFAPKHLHLRPKTRYSETTFIRSVSTSKEDGTLPIIQKHLTPLPSFTKPQVQTAQSCKRKSTVYPNPIPNLPTCSTPFSRKCWKEWRTTPGPGEYSVQSHNAVGTNNHAHNFGEVYVNGVRIERNSDAVHEKLEKERRRPDFYSYSTQKPYDSPCYLINPLGERKDNSKIQKRDPNLTLQDVRYHSNIRLRDVLRKSAIKEMGVTF